VDILKLLYLVRYVDDVKANLDNIVILIADDIRLDKITAREHVRGSLARLMSQNYIGRTGDTYNFLTDEEQDVQREIRNTPVATNEIVSQIGKIIFADIYTTKKFRYGKYDFSFDQMVDGQAVGATTGGMLLQIITVAADPAEKQKLRLLAESGGKAIVMLAEKPPYYEPLENSMKICKHVKHLNVPQLPQSMQNIIHNQQDEAGRYEQTATENLKKAIETAQFYVDGEHIEIKGGDAKSKIDQALEYLVTHVYSELGLITKFTENDADIYAILHGDEQMLQGNEPNRDAATKVEKYLEIQFNKNLPTTMSDVQERFQKKPYGWREIDIAAVVAMLICDQKVTVKYGGTTIRPSDSRLPDMLRKKSETGKTSVSMRQVVSVQKIREARDFLREFFDEMDVPKDEDGLIAYIVEKFTGGQNHYEALLTRYDGHRYPDRAKVEQAITLIKDVLSQQKDNTALITRVIQRGDTLFDMKDDLHEVESFFKTQVNLFDSAVKYEYELNVDLDYISKDQEANQALNQIRLITMIPVGSKFNYKRIPRLNELMSKVRTSHDAMLEAKRKELLEIVRQCMAEIHQAAGSDPVSRNISNMADNYFSQKKGQIASTGVLTMLDGLIPQMWQYKDDMLERIETLRQPRVRATPSTPSSGGGGQVTPPAPGRVIKTVHRQVIFPAKTMTTDAEIDAYVENIRTKMKQLLNGCDGIRLS